MKIYLLEVIIAFLDEDKNIAKQRKVLFNKAYIAIFKEQFQKYDKFCRLVNERLGENYLKEDGLKIICTEKGILTNV